MSTKFGLIIDFDLLKAATSTNAKPEIAFSVRGRHLDNAIWFHISAVADPEWHVNNGDEVKIETEKSDGLKARNFSLLIQVCKPGWYSYVKGCVFTGNILTVVGRHTICTASQTNLQPVYRNGRQHLAKTIRLKFSRKTANINVKKLLFYNNV